MTQKKNTSEDREEKVTSEVQEVEKADIISLDEYLNKVIVNPGLVASFKVEPLNSLEDKTEEQWTKAFKVQSARVYN
jgi:hypothetical protein